MIYSRLLKLIEPLLTAKPQNPYTHKLNAPQLLGWAKYNPATSQWKACDSSDLPPALVLDIETDQSVQQGHWTARIAVCFGSDGAWYQWLGRESLIEFPPGRVVIFHNGTEHDANYLSCLYNSERTEEPSYFIDTRVLAAIVVGVPSQVRPLWTKLKAQAERPGAQGHPWISTMSDLSLRALSSSQLGMIMDKTIHSLHPGSSSEALFNHYEPQAWAGVCAQDVQQTVRLLQLFWPAVGKAYGGDQELLWGLIKLMSATTIVSVQAISKKLETATTKALEVYTAALETAIAIEIAKPEADRRTDLDWSLASRGKGKGQPRWAIAARKKPGSFSVDELSVLQWKYAGASVTLEDPAGTATANRARVWATKVARLGPGLFVQAFWDGLTAADPAFSEVAATMVVQAKELKKLAGLSKKASTLHHVNGLARLPVEFGDPACLVSMPLTELLLDDSLQSDPKVDSSNFLIFVDEENDSNRLPPRCFSDPSAQAFNLKIPFADWKHEAFLFDRLARTVGKDSGQVVAWFENAVVISPSVDAVEEALEKGDLV